MNLPDLTLPWPARPLWPNARVHWRKLAEAKAAQKEDAMWAAMAANWHRKNVPVGVVEMDVHFCPPTGRSFDLDNALAAMKAALDGMSDMLRVDDRWFSPRLHRGEKCKGGKVVVSAFATGQPWQSIGCGSARLINEAARARVQARTGLTETQANGVQGMAQAMNTKRARLAQ